MHGLGASAIGFAAGFGRETALLGASGPWMTGGVGVSCPLLERKVLGSNPVLDTPDNGGVGWVFSFLFQLSSLSVLLYQGTFC